MAEAQLQQFLAKVSALNAFVALSEADPGVRAALTDCSNHHEVVELARRFGFEIGRRWGEAEGTPPAGSNLLAGTLPPVGQETTTVLLHMRQSPRVLVRPGRARMGAAAAGQRLAGTRGSAPAHGPEPR